MCAQILVSLNQELYQYSIKLSMESLMTLCIKSQKWI